MITSLTESKSQVIELSERAFKTFSDDISGMLDVDVKCDRQGFGNETVKGLEKQFENLTAVTIVRAKGSLNGTFQLVFDQQGLFILAGVIIMQDEQIIWENIKFGSLEKAKDMSSAFAEAGIALVGAWDRVFRKELDGHDSFTYINTFIGNPWDKPEEKINLPGNEEFALVTYQMTCGSYPPFKCGVIFPKEFFTDVSATVSEKPDFVEEKEGTEVTEEATEQVIEPEKTNAPDKPELPEQQNNIAIEEKNSDTKEEVQGLADTSEDEKHPVSEEIQKMTGFPAASTSEPTPPKEHQEIKTTNTPLAIYAKDIMQKDVLWSTQDDNVQQTLTKIKQHGTGYVMVGQDKILQGIVSKSDLTAALSPYLRPEFAKWCKPLDDASLKIRIKWIMSSPVHTVNLETPLAEIMENMCQSGQRALPVVDQQGKVQGLVTVFDIFKGLIKHFCRE